MKEEGLDFKALTSYEFFESPMKKILSYSKIPSLFTPFLIQLGKELQIYHQQQKLAGQSPSIIAKSADLFSEKKIRKKIHSHFPEHHILGEEEGFSGPKSDYTWIVDPIDGSSNYGAGLPYWCISIGLCKKGQVELGMVYLPCFEKFYSAIRGEGAFANKIPIHSLQDSSYQFHHLVGFSRTFKKKKSFPGKIRKLGSVALDLVYLAEGVFATIYEPEPHFWDMAAGYLLAKEAGAVLYHGHGKTLEPFDVEDISTFPLIGKANVTLPDPIWEDV